MITLRTELFDTEPNKGRNLPDKEYDEYVSNKFMRMSEYCNAVDTDIRIEGNFRRDNNVLIFPNIVMVDNLFLDYSADLTCLPDLKRVKVLISYTQVLNLGVLEEVDSIILMDSINTIEHIEGNLYAIKYKGEKIHTLIINKP